MVDGIWKDKGFAPGTINPEVTGAFSKVLWKAVGQGYGKDLLSIDYDTPDFNMLAALKKNVWQFSSAKNYTQMRQLSDALLDNYGKLRTFEQFKEAAFAINQDHIGRYLKAEYELAVAGSQMAGKWVEIEANKKILPLIQFDAVIDSQTTDLCKSLDGVTVPVDHPYVKKYYPPNHWGCRLTVRQLASGVVTKNLPHPEIPEMFRTNLGQQGLVFPKGHPYFIGTPGDVVEPVRKNLVPQTFQKTYAKDFKEALPKEFWELVPENQYYGRVPSVGRKAAGDAYYMPSTGDIIIKKGDRWKRSEFFRKQVVIHESAHAIHFKRNLITNNLIAPNVEKRMRALIGALEKDGDLSTLADKFRIHKHGENVRELLVKEKFINLGEYEVREMLTATMDMVNGITLKGAARRVVGYGHAPSYMIRGNNSFMEIFAHMMENKFLGNQVFEHYFPNLYQETIKLADDIIKNELKP